MMARKTVKECSGGLRMRISLDVNYSSNVVEYSWLFNRERLFSFVSEKVGSLSKASLVINGMRIANVNVRKTRMTLSTEYQSAFSAAPMNEIDISPTRAACKGSATPEAPTESMEAVHRPIKITSEQRDICN